MFRLKNYAIFAAISLVVFFAGCSAASPLNSSSKTDSFTNNTAAGITSDTSQSTAKNSTSSSLNQTSRKIVKNATLTVETLTYDKSITKLESLVSQFSGYVEKSTTEGQGLKNTDTTRTASYTIRIPADKLDSFLSSVGSIGNVLTKSLSGDDVTQSYYDTQSRLNALKIEQASLEGLLKKSGALSDIIQINDRLVGVNTEIEQLTSELQVMDSLVSLSTVTVTINEVAQITVKTDNFGSQLLKALTDSLNALLIVFKTIVTIIVYMAPFIIAFGVIALIIVFLIKFLIGRKKK